MRKLFHEAERLTELLAVGCFWNHDTVQSPNGIELELFGEMGEIDDFADGYFVPEVWQI
jgi:hypothetical protein